MTHPKIKKSISNLIENRLASISDSELKIINDALKVLLSEKYSQYSFQKDSFSYENLSIMSSDDFQSCLSKLNEKEKIRKEKGVYYTPKDVTRYIVSNIIINILDNAIEEVHSAEKCMEIIFKADKMVIENILFDKTILDPTSGSGEFLVSAFEYKIEILKKINKKFDDADIIRILGTIYGNDTNDISNEIAKIRLFFAAFNYISNKKNMVKISKKLNSNFLCEDFVNVDLVKFAKYDIIIGNPPYVETKKYDKDFVNEFGNIYANVLKNSVQVMKKNGILGFLIPISYVSTPRMEKIRNYIHHFTKKQYVLNYADRPDCLFSSVHQKLTILIACKASSKKVSLTSGYKYWYKSERNSLLNGCEMVENNHMIDNFIPKIGNQIEDEIFTKLYTTDGDTVLNLSNDALSKNIYLNMRGCFWIKAFTFNPGSSEYKKFSFEDEIAPYILCLLNSSLFFFFWNVTSDCWHITKKELSTFNVVIKNVNFDDFKSLSEELEKKLEKTKIYIGTKQVDYAYKHKDCKDVIDKIDDKLSTIYNLSVNEIQYIKNLNMKYRIGSDS